MPGPVRCVRAAVDKDTVVHDRLEAYQYRFRRQTHIAIAKRGGEIRNSILERRIEVASCAAAWSIAFSRRSHNSDWGSGAFIAYTLLVMPPAIRRASPEAP